MCASNDSCIAHKHVRPPPHLVLSSLAPLCRLSVFPPAPSSGLLARVAGAAQLTKVLNRAAKVSSSTTLSHLPLEDGYPMRRCVSLVVANRYSKTGGKQQDTVSGLFSVIVTADSTAIVLQPRLLAGNTNSNAPGRSRHVQTQRRCTLSQALYNIFAE